MSAKLAKYLPCDKKTEANAFGGHGLVFGIIRIIEVSVFVTSRQQFEQLALLHFVHADTIIFDAYL